MVVSRETLTAFALTLSLCRPGTRPPPALPAEAAASTTPATVQDARPSPVTTIPADNPSSTRPQPASASDPVQSALALAFADTSLTPEAFDRVLTDLNAAPTPRVARALTFAAARRAPASSLARLWTAIPPGTHDALARGLAGRTRAQGIPEFPPPLLPAPPARPSVPVATIINRFRLDPPGLPLTTPLLTSGALEDQLVGARLLTAPSVPLPDNTQLGLLTPFAIPHVVRSLSNRTDTPWQHWTTLLGITAAAARAAPRQWGNAWRSVRDAVPTNRPELKDALRRAATIAGAAEGLSRRTGSHWRCENAVAIDKLDGWPLETTRCAADGFEGIGRLSQAQVLGSATTEPARRADGLMVILMGAHGEPQVLEAIATAAVELPPTNAASLLRVLARERDPGVLAALLEALSTHPQHMQTLNPTQRLQLLRAPFERPEGSAIEARVQAIRLAHTLRIPEVIAQASESSIRAIQHAREPDAGVLPALQRPPAQAPEPIGLRIVTEVGTIELELRPEFAPLAVAQIVTATRAHRYDGLTFHRVVPGFVVQGGDPRGDGYGGTDTPIPTELSFHTFDRGSVGVPLAGLDTGGIQLFFVLADTPHLDGRYPWVGRIRRGIDIVDSLLIGDRIEHVELIDLDENP